MDIYSQYLRNWEGTLGFGRQSYADARAAGYTNQEILAGVSGKPNVGDRAMELILAGVRTEQEFSKKFNKKISDLKLDFQQQAQAQQRQFETLRAQSSQRQQSLQDQLKQATVKQVPKPTVSGVNTTGGSPMTIKSGTKKFAREDLKIGSVNI